MSADAPIVSVRISRIIQIWDGIKMVVVEILKAICGGRNTEN